MVSTTLPLVLLLLPQTSGGRNTPVSCGGQQVTFPNVDDGLVCGECKVLVDDFQRYGSCNAYCQAIGRECVGAWEEQDDNCQVRYEMSCEANAGGSTSDALCECSGPSASSCDASKCRERGGFDSDCCGIPQQISCADGYTMTLDKGNGCMWNGGTCCRAPASRNTTPLIIGLASGGAVAILVTIISIVLCCKFCDCCKGGSPPARAPQQPAQPGIAMQPVGMPMSPPVQRFDPNTGQPLRFDPNTGQPLQPQPVAVAVAMPMGNATKV